MATVRAQPSPEDLLAGFGLESFRAGQREAVAAALEGRDSLVVMPTGGGKSLCYQLPALACSQQPEDPERGLVVVVSPLIALMSDQWQRLQQAGVSSTMLASTMDDAHNDRALAEIASGAAALVLAAPERFASRAFAHALAQRRVALFVVDEAHCVAEWGHDFRPDYLRLHDAISSLRGLRDSERPAVMAATATATPRVAREIAARLGLREPVSVRSGFDRPNLSFDVVSVEGKGAMARKWAALMHVLAGERSLPAIVYCGTRKDTDEIAKRIAAEGITAVPYHAGMGAAARTESQRAFMSGEADVAVATNAFGMGVDKADVRTVAHWALPTSLEAYYQEAGRGGRDGDPARALLLAARVDLGRLIRFNKDRETTVSDVRSYVARLRSAAGEDGAVVIGHGQLSDRARVLLSIAERAGAVELAPAGREGLLVRPTGQGSPRRAAAAIAASRERGWESYRSIERYMEASTCRRAQILQHFGDPEKPAPTGRCCDVCDPDEALAQAVSQAPTRGVRARRGRGSGRDAAAAVGARAVEGAGAADEGIAADIDEREFDALRTWRLERSEGKPAYTVAPNAVLEEVLRTRPGNVGELIAIRGIGPAFCERHGESLLAELARLEAGAGEGAEVLPGPGLQAARQ